MNDEPSATRNEWGAPVVKSQASDADGNKTSDPASVSAIGGQTHVPPTTPEDGLVSNGEPVVFQYHGRARDLFVLSFINAGLTLVTLGLYYPWAKTEVRRRLWHAVRVNDEPLVYTGTGRELFLGLLIVFALVLLPFTVLVTWMRVVFPHDPTLLFAALVPGYIILFFLFGVAVYRARRYRLSRTAWRGVRGSLSGNAISYGWAGFWASVGNMIALGWMTPWQANMLNRILTNEMQFGDRHFAFSGQAGPLYGRFTVMYLGIFGLYLAFVAAIFGLVALFPDEMTPTPDGQSATPSLWMWVYIASVAAAIYVLYTLLAAIYEVRVMNYFAENTRYGDLAFGLNANTFSYAWIAASNTVLVILTLGILKPVAQARTLRYLVNRLSTDGEVDFMNVRQNPRALDRTGEGLAQAFDIDAF